MRRPLVRLAVGGVPVHVVPVHVVPDPDAGARWVARAIREVVEARRARGQDTVLGLLTGATPVPVYRELVRLHREERFSFRDVTTFNLDEYLGVPPESPESYHRFMRVHLFDHVDLDPARTHLPDGSLPDEALADHCAAFEARIREAGGIDLQLLGLGRSGHVGFNEPGSAVDSRMRPVGLDPRTRLDAAPGFGGLHRVPQRALTLGVGTILEARRVILMAWGGAKAAIVARALTEPRGSALPATFLRDHPEVAFVVDAAAAAEFPGAPAPAGDPLPPATEEEEVHLLAEDGGVRIERIVSRGHASPPGFWYDQAEHEWVMVLRGRARLEVAEEAAGSAARPRGGSGGETIRVVEMAAGDHILLPAHRRHRVAWTDPEQETVWLAVFYR